MFCLKCGQEHSDNAAFCARCGASFAVEEITDEVLNTAVPTTKKEHVASHCSASTKKKRKAIKILSIVSLAIQGVLAIWMVIGVGTALYALYAAGQNSLFEGIVSGVLSLLITLALTLTGSFTFTLLGIKKNSTGFFVAAAVFASLSGASCSAIFEVLALRQLVLLGTLAIYIVIIVLNHLSNKECKEYASQKITTKREDKKSFSKIFTTHKEGGRKKVLVLAIVIGLVILCAFVASALPSCGAKSCHRCDEPVGSDPVEAGGRTYCSYDCYMNEVLFD